MTDTKPTRIANLFDDIKVYFYRLAASGALPARWFETRVPLVGARAARRGRLSIELVSHCWGYSHMMLYQLSALVLHPPQECDVTMTVFYSTDDVRTVRLLEFFAQQQVPGVSWNWQQLNKHSLFRRSIGRNQAALATKADWIWFTDCDLICYDNCLDALTGQLQGRQDALVYPMNERTTPLLMDDDPMLTQDESEIRIEDIQTDEFETHDRTRATGPLQITHGDVARACGYCDCIPVYQKPARHWCKAHEDRAFRWLLETQGVGIDVPGVYRIRHVMKGRYKKDSTSSRVRTRVRAVQSTLRGE